MKNAIDVVAKLRQKSVLKRLGSVDWADPAGSNPFIVELDPTAACDLACPGCISEDIISQGGRFTNQRLIELADEFAEAGVQGVILIGGGEPLAHPAVGQLLERLAQHNIAVGITTNGTFIHRHLDVIAQHAFWTRVSMDAGTQKTFDQLRPSKAGRSKFSDICKNIEDLAARKQGILGYSYLIQSEADGPGVVSNAEEIVVAAKLARDLGCDYFEVKPTYEFRGNVPHALVEHSAEERALAAQKVAELKALETEQFSIYQAINLSASLAGVQTLQLKNYSHCPSAQMRTLVTPKGAYVCPYWRGKDEFQIGDVSKQSFIEMWRSDARVSVMNNLNPSKDCQFHCLRHASNENLIGLRDQLSSGEPIESEADFDPFI